MLPALRPAIRRPIKSPILSAASSGASWNPSSISGLVQRFADSNKTFLSTALGGVTGPAVLSPEELGIIAVPRGQRCYLFDGTDDRAIGSAPVLSGSGDFTLCAWIKPTAGGVFSHCIFGNYDSGFPNGFELTFYQDKLSLYIGAYIQSTATLSLNMTYHVAAVRQSGVVSFYINGAFDSSSAMAGSISGGPITVGALHLFAQEFFQGKMWDLRIYSNAKNASQIAAIYSQSLTPTTVDSAGLLAHWPLQEESGTIGYDVSGNGNHLALTNITASTFHSTDAGVNWSYPNAKGHSRAIVHTHTAGNWNNFAVYNNPIVGDGYAEFLYTGGDVFFALVDTKAVSASSSYTGFKFAFDTQPTGGFVFESGVQGATVTNAMAYGDVVRISRTGTTVSVLINGVSKATFVATSSATLYPATSVFTGTSIILNCNGAAAVPETSSGPVTFKDLVIPARVSGSLDAIGKTTHSLGAVKYPAVLEIPCGAFDGSDDYGISGSNVGIIGDANLTISANITFDSTSVDNSPVVTFGDWSGLFAAGMLTRSNGAFGFYIGGGVYVESTSGLLQNGRSYHVAVTKTAGAMGTGTVSLYLNGVQVSGTLTSSGTTFIAASSVRVGGDSTTSLYAKHKICNVAVYSVVKTPSEIAAIAAGSIDTTSARVVYPMQEGAGTTIYDVSGNANHATLTNTTAATFWAGRYFGARDHSVQYGGGRNGLVFVPGLPSTGNDAAGNAKTLTPGSIGNPASRVYPNYWGAPSLANVGYTSTTKLEEVPCWTGDPGNGTYIDLASPLIPSTSDFSLSMWYYHTANDTNVRALIAQRFDSPTGFVTIAANQNASGAGEGGKMLFVIYQSLSSHANGSMEATGLQANTWHYVELIRVGTAITGRATPYGGSALSVVGVINGPLYTAENTRLGIAGAGGSAVQNIDGKLSGFQITTGGTTKYFPLSEGSGRDVACYSSNAQTILTNAVKNGSLSVMWAAKTSGYFSVPYAEQSIVPRNTKFRRTTSSGNDRYVATLAPLTGSDLTNAMKYTQ